MKIYGHRGAAGLVAENTIESITEALKHSVDGIEIDVHCCKTGELIVIHDETLERTTSGEGEVANYTLQELKQFKIEEGFQIPTLDEVLDIINGQCELNIELKGQGTAIPTIKLAEKYINTTDWTHNHFIISSFDHSQLFAAKEVTPKFRLGVLTEENITEVLHIAQELKAFSIHPPIFSSKKEEVALSRKLGFQVYVWTVNTKSLIKQSKSWNVDGIITDFPNLAL